MADQLGQLLAVVLGQLELGLFTVLIHQLSNPAQDIRLLGGLRVSAHRRDQALMDGLLDPVQVRNPGGKVLRLAR